jgi:PAS domain S-box-containing protein
MKKSGVKMKKSPNKTKAGVISKKPDPEIIQEALSRIVETARDAILSNDLNGTILTWNEGAQRIYGYTKEEMIGNSFSNFMSPGRQKEIAKILQRARKGEVIDQFETIHKRKDGMLIDISLSVTPIKNKAGKISAASIVARDITEDKRLRSTRNFLAAIVDSSDDAIFSKNLDGIILSWNKSAEILYGYSATEAIGSHVSLLTPPERKQEVDQIIDIIKSGERVDHYETHRVTKDNREISVSLTASPVLDSKGKLIAVSVIARDITVKKKAEEERARLLAELTQALQEKNVLLQEVYHRVKNNLQVIGSMLDLRSRYLDDDPRKVKASFLESITRIRAMALIHESLYKTENLEKLDFLIYLRTLSKQLLDSYAPEKSISINVTGSSQFYGLDMAVSLGLIFNELITNSLKYAFNGSNEGVIQIDFSSNSKKTTINIIDNGVGLPADFEFGTANSFGFKIVKLLAKQLNASIVHKPQARGTAFELTFLLQTEESNAF